MYYYREVMERKLKEHKNKNVRNTEFNKNNLRRSREYKLYDAYDNGEFVFELNTAPDNKPYVVTEEESQKIENSQVDPKTANKIRENENKFRKNNQKKNKKNKKKKKGIIAAVTALILAGVMTVSGFLIASKLKKKDNNGPTNSTSTSQKADNLGTGSLDSLGEQLPTEKKGSEYAKVSGDINIEDIVRGADGVLYDNEESARNATKSGSVEIDTKGGTLVVADNGKVYTKEDGYEVVDENGNVVDSGNGTPNVEESGIDYVECPCNYYDDEGNLVHSTGEFITPQELERCSQYYHTTKPEKDEYEEVKEEIIYYDNYTAPVGNNDKKSTIEQLEQEEKVEKPVEEDITYEEDTTTSYSDNGVVNSDGTYTIYGITYASYADYQQYIFNDGEGYGYIDGVIQPIGDYEIEYQYTK